MIEYIGEFFRAFVTFCHERFCQPSESAQINKHRTSLQATLPDAVAVIFLNKVWQKMSQSCGFGYLWIWLFVVLGRGI